MEIPFNAIDGIHVIRSCLGGGYGKGVWWLVKVLANTADTQTLCNQMKGAGAVRTFHPFSAPFTFARTFSPSCPL